VKNWKIKTVLFIASISVVAFLAVITGFPWEWINEESDGSTGSINEDKVLEIHNDGFNPEDYEQLKETLEKLNAELLKVIKSNSSGNTVAEATEEEENEALTESVEEENEALTESVEEENEALTESVEEEGEGLAETEDEKNEVLTENKKEKKKTEALKVDEGETVELDKPEEKQPEVGQPETVKFAGIYNIKGQSGSLGESSRESLNKWRREIVELAAGNKDLVKINGNITQKRVALTFDDGPDNNVTPRIIEILDEYNVKGNFFFTGSNVKAFPKVVQSADQSGHMVLSHSYYHENYNNISYDEIKKDFEKTNEAIENLTGSHPSFMRPPYGIVNDNVLRVAENKQQNIIIWSTDSMDWSQKDPQSITDNVLDHVRPGEIILMHSFGGNKATAKALPDIIEGLVEKGYEIVTLDEMLR